MASVSIHTRHPPYSYFIAWCKSSLNRTMTISVIPFSCSSRGYMYAMEKSQSCQRDIWRTVLKKRGKKILTIEYWIIFEKSMVDFHSCVSICHSNIHVHYSWPKNVEAINTFMLALSKLINLAYLIDQYSSCRWREFLTTWPVKFQTENIASIIFLNISLLFHENL